MPTNPTKRYQPINPRVERDRVLMSVRVDRSVFNAIERMAQENNVPVVAQLRKIIEERV